MSKFISILAAAAVLGGVSAASAAAPMNPETRLARALEGRIAGKPVDCINLRRIRSSEIIEDTAIVFHSGSTIYVNRPEAGQTSLDRGDAIVTDTRSPELCSIDTVTLIDTSAGMWSGVAFLGKFVPYRKPGK